MLTGLTVCLVYLFIAHPVLRAVIGLPGPPTLVWGIQPASAGLFGVPVGALALIVVSLLTPARFRRRTARSAGPLTPVDLDIGPCRARIAGSPLPGHE
jgi:Na+(H+)/acetate symporter ActP